MLQLQPAIQELGAAEEAALNGIPAIGVSLEAMSPDADFSAVKKYFPDIFKKIISDLPEKKGIFYNVNFPNLPAADIKGIRVGYQGYGYWTREFKEWDPKAYSKFESPRRCSGKVPWQNVKKVKNCL